MRSIIGTIIMFVVIYVIVTSNVLDFFAQKSFSIFAESAAVFMLVLAFIVLAVLAKKKGGLHDKEENKHPD